jgi:ATP-dependent Lhr-like helicase
MYEGDTPNAERRAAALSLDRDLLRELLGQDELRELIDPDALALVGDDLQHRSERMRAATRDELADLLRRLGDLTVAEAAQRSHEPDAAEAWLTVLADERRAVRLRVGGEERWVAADDAGLYRDALGAVPPGGLPEAFLADVPDALAKVVARYARTHGPFTTEELRARYNVDPGAVLALMEAAGDLVRGELRPDGAGREWCDPDVLRRLRRASLASLRKEIEPADQRALAAFAPSWQGVDRHAAAGAGRDRLREVLVPLQGLALPAEVWEREVLPRRTGAYSPTWLDELCASGEVVWVGAGALGRNSGKVALYFREDAEAIGRVGGMRSAIDAPGDPAHELLRERLRAAPCFFSDLLAEVALAPEDIQDALWDLVWAGEVTNDAWAPLRAPRLTLARAQRATLERRARGARRFGARRGGTQPTMQGRWSLTSSIFRSEPDPRQQRRTLAELLLERHGILTRETVLAEGIPGGFSALYDALTDLETLGVCRRGYFVEGLGGAQFALPGAVERLRARRDDDTAPPLVLAATDPAQPYGAALPWPKRDGEHRRPARVAGAHVVLVGAEPVIYVERGGRGLALMAEPDDPRVRPALEALVAFVTGGRGRKLSLERVDGEPIVGSPVEETLVELGFRSGPRKLTLSA